ncbi:glutamyl-tRNA reductase [Rugosimonospora acidiphila]|uniref:Glutamyl-tRNA reductase n=1 Tax=Rugosimonospora acidiphila TaxID=556531 RepID=A0ABP9RHK9_9ACTN
MNLVVVGVSYRTAPVPVLERLAAPPVEVPEILAQLLAQPFIGEALMLSTCNRIEVYAGVSAFHGGLSDIVSVLAPRAGSTPAELAPYAYVHYDAEAVRHAYRVATGLDSMVIGEAQILGQLRDAYAVAAEHDATGRLLHELMQQALRVGKRAHAETGIDRAGQSVVSAALNLAAAVGSTGPDEATLAGRSALVVGAGAMGSLALATLRRAGAGPLYVTNRSAERAARLAELYDAAARPELDLSNVDLVVSATASSGHVITAADVTGPVTIVDLAVPRDVAPEVADLPGVEVIDIERLGTALAADGGLTADTAAVADIVEVEVEAFLAWLRSSDVAPTVAALRARADEVVAAELRRLSQRRTELTDEQRAEVARTIHRVVQRLLHQPTVRVRELAAGPGGDRYAALLRELFDLDVPSSGAVNGVPEVES